MSQSPFTQIDLSKLPAPHIVVEASFDDIYAQMIDTFKADNPTLSDSLDFESEPMTALNQAWAYREYILRQDMNKSMRGIMLAFAEKSSLDHLAALVPLTRNTDETDADFKARVQLAPEGFSVAGPVGAYIFHAKEAHGDVVDVYIPETTAATAGQVHVYVLVASGSDSVAVLAAVNSALSDDLRPLNDYVTVFPATFEDYSIQAELSLKNGPDSSFVLNAAQASAQSYVNARIKFGLPIYRTALIAALFVSGVEDVNLIQPAQDVVVAANHVARMTSISVLEAANV